MSASFCCAAKRSLRIAAPMNQSRQTAGTSTANNKSTTGQTSLSWPVRAMVRMSLRKISISENPLSVFQLRLKTSQRLLQLVILELYFRRCFAVQHVARGAVFLILFRFLVRQRDFVTWIG